FFVMRHFGSPRHPSFPLVMRFPINFLQNAEIFLIYRAYSKGNIKCDIKMVALWRNKKMALVRRMPLRELAAMQNVVDRLFYDTLRCATHASEIEAQTLAVNLYEKETNYTISTLVPGDQPDAIQFKVEDNVLTIASNLA